MLLDKKEGDLAENMYNKLLACAHTNQDIMVKMFAYKQLGYTYIQLKRYVSSLMAFKHMLAVAWTIKSCEGEFSAYEGLARAYLYQGMIEKVKFYNDRITAG